MILLLELVQCPLSLYIPLSTSWGRGGWGLWRDPGGTPSRGTLTQPHRRSRRTLHKTRLVKDKKMLKNIFNSIKNKDEKIARQTQTITRFEPATAAFHVFPSSIPTVSIAILSIDKYCLTLALKVGGVAAAPGIGVQAGRTGLHRGRGAGQTQGGQTGPRGRDRTGARHWNKREISKSSQ